MSLICVTGVTSVTCWRRLIVVLLAVTAGAVACAPRVATISVRNPDLFDKESDGLAGRSRGMDAAPAPEMFIKKKTVVIKDMDRANETGSLFNADDERNHLFTANYPQSVGRYLTVAVVPGRATAKPGDKATDKPADAAAAAKGADDIEKELLKAVPDLTPGKPGEVAALKSFKMKILYRYANGDVLAQVDRESTSEEESTAVSAQARVPYERLVSGDQLTTEDLMDVNFKENSDGSQQERTSSHWEDEYSLRLSGFKEAKSKAALELDEKRQQLEAARAQVDTRIKTFGEERRQVAKQRDELNQKKAEQEEAVKGLNGKVGEQQKALEEQQKTIEAQQQQIQSLEQKPGDAKEPAGDEKA